MFFNFEFRRHLRLLREKRQWDVLSYMMMCSNHRLRCWPSLSTIAADIGASKTTVGEAIDSLIENGALLRVPYENRESEEKRLPARLTVYQLTGRIRDGDGWRDYVYFPNETMRYSIGYVCAELGMDVWGISGTEPQIDVENDEVNGTLYSTINGTTCSTINGTTCSTRTKPYKPSKNHYPDGNGSGASKTPNSSDSEEVAIHTKPTPAPVSWKNAVAYEIKGGASRVPVYASPTSKDAIEELPWHARFKAYSDSETAGRLKLVGREGWISAGRVRPTRKTQRSERPVVDVAIPASEYIGDLQLSDVGRAVLKAMKITWEQLGEDRRPVFLKRQRAIEAAGITAEEVPALYEFVASMARELEWKHWTERALATYAPDFKMQQAHKKGDAKQPLFFVDGEWLTAKQLRERMEGTRDNEEEAVNSEATS